MNSPHVHTHESDQSNMCHDCLSCEAGVSPWRRHRHLCLVFVVFGVLLLGLLKYGVIGSWDFPPTQKTVWQAVFLNNNQTYFGHLKSYNEKYAVLEDIFYIRAAGTLQQGSSTQPEVNIVKLGTELHGPEDRMFIPKDKIMFWENLRADSQIVQGIARYQKGQ